MGKKERAVVTRVVTGIVMGIVIVRVTLIFTSCRKERVEIYLLIDFLRFNTLCQMCNCVI